MESASVSARASLRLAPTHAASDRARRAVDRACAAGVAGLGLWQVTAVENGALGTIAGLALLALVPSLSRGRTRAHRWACALTAILAVTAELGSPSGSGGQVAAVAFVLLAAAAPAFEVRGDPATARLSLAAAALAIGAAAADVAHARGLLGHPLLATCVCVAACLAVQSLRPWKAAAPASAAERALAASIVERDGTDTLAPFALRPDKRYFFDQAGEAFLAYTVVAGVAIVSGDAVGPPELVGGLTASFSAYARMRGWTPAAISVGVDGLRAWRALGYHAHYIGDEAVVDPARFTLDGRAVRKLRQSVTRLTLAGYRVELRYASEIDAALERSIGEIADAWREGRVETGFSMAFASAHVDRARNDLYAVALDGSGEARGFLHFAVVPAANALSLSSMRRDRSTPNGLNEFLICETLARVRERGVTRVSLNFAAFAQVLDAPGAGDPVAAVERRLLRRLSGRFQLERLLSFNRKFGPAWVPRYAVYPGVAALPRVALAVMLAESYVVLPSRARP